MPHPLPPSQDFTGRLHLQKRLRELIESFKDPTIKRNITNYHVKRLESDPDEWSEAQTEKVIFHIQELEKILESPFGF